MSSTIDSGALSFQGLQYLAPVLLLLAGVVALMFVDMWHRRGDGKSGGLPLGKALWISGKHQEARRVWAAAVARAPDAPLLKATMARFLKDAP